MSSQFIVAEIFQAMHRKGAPKFLLSLHSSKFDDG